jgi:diguanylate cyclase (GGDEF)-like protein
MNRLLDAFRPVRSWKLLRALIVVITFSAYLVIAVLFNRWLGNSVIALSLIPVALACGFFNTRTGLFTALFALFCYTLLQAKLGVSAAQLFTAPGMVLGSLSLIFSSLFIGRLLTVSRERGEAVTRLAQANRLIYSILHVTTQIETSLSPDEFARSLSQQLRAIDIDHVIARFDGGTGQFRFSYSSIQGKSLEIIAANRISPIRERAFTLHHLGISANEKGRLSPVVIHNHHAELRALFGEQDSASLQQILSSLNIHPRITVFRLPLVVEEKLLGILWTWGNGLVASDLPVLSIFAKQVGISLERARLFQEVQDLALTDPLTSLPNRRSLFTLGELEFTRAMRLSRPFCCLMLDLDDFKGINDIHGHMVGDLVLQSVAEVCRNNVRSIDLIGRYGGEEITILLPDTELQTAIRIAERLKNAVCENQIQADDHTIRTTVSIGVATKDQNTLDLKTLIARADQAMYMAKHKGKNRVAISR